MGTRRQNGEGSIYKRKDGRWEATIYLRTSADTRKRFHFYGITREEAHTKLVAAAAKAQKGIPAPDRAWRFDAYFEHWLPIVQRTKRPMTHKSYESIVRLYLNPGLGKKQLTRLTVLELQRYLDAELDRGVSLRNVQKQRTVLSAALARAEREELVSRNVAHHVELPTHQRREIRPWTAAQVNTFLSAARPDPLYAAFLLVALYGLRSGEVRGLRWRDIEVNAMRLHIRQQLQRWGGELRVGPVKTNAGRRDLPLLPAVLEALDELRPTGTTADSLVFVTRFDKPLEGGNLLRSFKRISRGCGLPALTMHQLRHTTSTLLKNTGVPVRDAQLILGHANVTTTLQLYQHADVAGQERALSQLQGVVLPAGAGSGCRQQVPSTSANLYKSQRFQSGGSSQTRTGDTRLFSFTEVSVPQSVSEARLLVAKRGRVLLLGAAAVICSRQTNASLAPDIGCG